jgi:ferrous iron transport protein B
MFFVAGSTVLPLQSFYSTVLLISIIVFSVFVTLISSKVLSVTVLKGIPSSFILELPPYRTPQVGKVIIRSIFDRTLFVLGRAIIVAAPAGLIVWLMSNIFIGNASILSHCSNFLDPFAHAIGLDGVILLAFILGFPANEIVIPIILMAYLCEGSMVEYENLAQLQNILVSNGWTTVTAVCFVLFSLFHFPCGTTCLTIKKETGSFKWAVIAFIFPTLIGITLCFIVALTARLIGLS